MSISAESIPSWWERKHFQRGGTYPNPNLEPTIANANAPTAQIQWDQSPTRPSYPDNFAVANEGRFHYQQLESQIPETRYLADVYQRPHAAVGWMSAHLGTEDRGNYIVRN